MIEEWRDVPGFEGFYQISSHGRIKNVKTNYITTGSANQDGYLKTDLYKNKKRNGKFLHRLVLEAFVGPAPTGHTCNHKNGIRNDNRIENLEWITHIENVRHRDVVLKSQAIGDRHGKVKLTANQVVQIKRLLNKGERFVDIARKFNVTTGCITPIRNGKSWKHVTID